MALMCDLTVERLMKSREAHRKRTWRSRRAIEQRTDQHIADLGREDPLTGGNCSHGGHEFSSTGVLCQVFLGTRSQRIDDRFIV